jgi:hypothetical protein
MTIKVLCIFLLGFICYANTLKGDFIWDDNYHIVKSIHLEKKGVASIFSRELFDSGLNYYRPVYLFTFFLEYRLWKLNPLGYHLVNILLHCAAAALIFILLRYLLRNLNSGEAVAFLASILFVVHPVHTEAVSYISARADSLLAIFVILSLLLYLESFGLKAVRRFVFLAASLLSFVLGLMTKEAALVLVLFLLLCNWYIGEGKSRLKTVTPFLLVGVLYIISRITFFNFSQGLSGTFSRLGVVTLKMRLVCFLKELLVFAKILVLPFGLHIERMFKVRQFFDSDALLAIFFISLLALCLIKSRIPRRIFIFSLMWFFIALLPQSAFIIVYLAEHFLYLPSVGFFILAAYLLVWLRMACGKLVFLSATLALMIYFGSITISQNLVWQNDLTLFTWTKKYAPHSSRARFALADYYFKKGDASSALREYQELINATGNAFTSLISKDLNERLQREGLGQDSRDLIKRFISVI